MGLLSSTRKIYRTEFEKVLRTIPDLSEIERAYVSGVFQDALRDGLSKIELKKEIEKLKYNFQDPLDASEVKKIKEKLLERFK